MKRIAMFSFVLLLGCGGGGTTNTPPSLTRLSVSLSAKSVQVGSSVSATAVGFDQSGAQVGVGSISWTASPAAIATVSSGGSVTGVSPGSALVTATSGAVVANAQLTVLAPPPATCGSESALVIDQIRSGNLLASLCVLLDTPAMFTFRTQFTGPQVGGTYFYDRYTIDVPAGAILRFDISNVGNTIGFISIAYDSSGTFAAVGTSSSNPLVINNASASLRRYQVIVSSSRPVQTGAYTILPKRIL